MNSYEQYLVTTAAQTVARLQEVVDAGTVTIEGASTIGQSMALLQNLSDALAARSASTH